MMTDFISYNKLITDSENQIVQNKFTEALKGFKTVYGHFEYLFPRDAYVACQTAAITGAEDDVKFFLSLCMEEGAQVDFLKKNYMIKDYVPGAKPPEKKQKNSVVKNRICQIYNADREYLHQYNSIVNIFNKNKILQKWDAFSSDSTKELSKIIEIHGFPSYRLIGIDRQEDMKKNDFKDFLSSHMAVILISHDIESFPVLDSLLKNEMRKGNLNVRGYAFLRDLVTYKRQKKKILKNDEYDNYTYGFFYNEISVTHSDKKKYDQERADIGMCSIDTENIKYKFNQNFLSNQKPWQRKKENAIHFISEDIC